MILTIADLDTEVGANITLFEALPVQWRYHIATRPDPNIFVTNGDLIHWRGKLTLWTRIRDFPAHVSFGVISVLYVICSIGSPFIYSFVKRISPIDVKLQPIQSRAVSILCAAIQTQPSPHEGPSTLVATAPADHPLEHKNAHFFGLIRLVYTPPFSELLDTVRPDGLLLVSIAPLWSLSEKLIIAVPNVIADVDPSGLAFVLMANLGLTWTQIPNK